MSNYNEIKQVCGLLDTAASRAEMAGATEATGKQCWFLAKLLVEKGQDHSEWLDSNATLTKRNASALISGLLEG